MVGQSRGTNMGHAGHRGRDIRQPLLAHPTLILKWTRHYLPVLLEAWLHCRVPRSPVLPPHQCPQAQIESPTNWLASQVGQLGLQIPVTSCVLLPLEHTVSHIFRFPLSTSKTPSSRYLEGFGEMLEQSSTSGAHAVFQTPPL